nr:hypothetical protein [Tanacetum cinerariifolium]
EQAPPLPDYISGPEHADDEIVAEDQPYAKDATPIAQSPEYVLESNFEMYPEDDDDEDPEEDPVDYPADGGDDDDDEEESSEDEEDDEMDVEADKKEEEHPAPTDSVVVAPTAADQAPSAEETEPFEMDESAATPPPHPAYRMMARISIPALVPMPAWTDSKVVRLFAISSPPASPLSPWSLPPPQIPFPLLPPILSPPSPILAPAPPPSPIRSLGYRAAMIRLRDEAASTSHSPPLQLPSASRREDRPEVTLPPRKRLDIALGPRYEVGESSSAVDARPAGGFRADYGFVAAVDREIMRDPKREVGYGITDSWDEIVETLQGAPTVGHEAAYGMSWKMPMKMMTDKYCPRNEIRKLEIELWELKESDKVKKYVGGLPDMIHGSVVASKPKMMSVANTNNANNQRGTGSGQKLGCYECGVQGHFRRQCPKLKNNNNHGNQGRRNNAPARVYAVGRAGTDPDANVVT